MTRRSWTKANHPNGEKYIHLTPTEVVVGSHYGSGHTDNAGSCSHAAFRAGQYHDVVRRDHGEEVLAEVMQALGAPVD